MVSGGGGSYYAAGASTDLTFNTVNKTLTSPNAAITSTNNATSTLTGALIVTGGVGIGNDLWVGGSIFAQQLVIQYTTVTTVSVVTDDVTQINNTTNASSTATGALQVWGGAGIGKDLWVGGDINFKGNLYQNGTLFTGGGGGGGGGSLTGGTLGQIPWQTAASTTGFFGPGTSGQLLVSSGASVIGPVFRNTSTIIVGYSANLTGGATGSIPYQSNPSTTAMLALGSANQILSVNATGNGLIWTTGIATSTANNLTGGSTNKIPYQTGAGATSFFGPGTDGQVLVSKGTTVGGPVFTDTSQITAGKATNLVGGLKGSLPYQTAVDSTLMLGIGTANQVLTVNSTGDGFIWAAPQSGAASTANNIVGGSSGRVLWQVDVDQTGFTNAGSAGQILISGGTSSPTWSAVGTLSATGGTGGIGLMTVTGEIRATKEITAYYSSDIRLKENVTVIENALEKVKSLSGVMFDWKDDVIENRGGDDNYFVRKHDTGIIAQDVEKVLPEVVAVRDDGFLAVRYEKLAGLIIQAINELAAEVDELKKQIQ
jgi:hypothetical protein